MKMIYLLMITGFLFVSCASSQNNTSRANTPINEWRSLLKLSAEQVKKLETVERDYQARAQKLKAADKNYDEQLFKLKQKRTVCLQRILSREQYIKFQALENHLIKKVPVRL
ncbi:hypothetical protein [Niabella aquatica]